MGILPKLNATRLLLVEDTLAVNERLRDMLREAGYEVETAYNIGDALAAKHDRFVLAVVNGAMHNREGRSILELIRDVESFAALPIVLTDDGHSLVERVATALMRGRERNIEQVIASVAKTATQEAIRVTHEALVGSIPSIYEDDDPTARTPAAMATNAQFRQQLATLRTLSELGRSISSVLELSQVLNQIVEAATTLTSAEEGMLLLPDEDDKALYLRAKKGIDNHSAQNFRIKSDEPLVGTVYRTGNPVLIGDRGPMRLKTEYFVKSLVYVPLRSKGRVIGVLGVNNRQTPRLFSVTDLELLTDLAAYAAIAIENARLYEERLVQNRRLTTLVETGIVVNSTLALSDVLLNICRQIIKALDVNACVIRQNAPQEETPQHRQGQTSILPENNLRDLAMQWQAIWSPDDGPRTSLDERPALRRALTQNVSYVAQRDQAGGRANVEVAILEAYGARQMAVLPLRTGGQTIYGVLELFYRRDVNSPAQEVRAQVRAIATEIYALIRVRGDFRPDADIVAKAGEILRRAEADWLALHILTSEGQMAKVLQYGSSVYLEDPYPTTQDLPPQFQPVFQDARPVSYHMRQPNLPDTVREVMAGVGAEVMLGLPLSIKGRTVGMFLIFGAGETRSFSSEDIGLAAALIAQAATAIENARLYRDLERSLTGLKQAQASLVQAARLSTMGELAAVVAHQINNPLTTVMVDSEILLDDMPKDSPYRESVQAIRRAGQRAHTVVKRLLSTARRSTNDVAQWVDLHQTIRNTLDLVSTHIERGRVRFEVDLDTSLPSYVRAMTGHLEDVWLNLLVNARDALTKIEGEGVMGISTRRAAQSVDVLVWDNGPGIPAEFRDKIFEPFFTTKPTGEGTGLGLYICKQVIQEIGGRIAVDTSQGQGTCFRISLPVSARGA